MTKKTNPFRSGTKRFLIAKELISGKTQLEVFDKLIPLVGKKEPWIFRTVDYALGLRKPYPKGRQQAELAQEIQRTAAILAK